MSKMCVAAASATGEPLADGGESAIVLIFFVCEMVTSEWDEVP